MSMHDSHETTNTTDFTTRTRECFKTVPERPAAYIEMWAPLLDVDTLTVPLGLFEHGVVAPATEDEQLSAIDTLKWSDGADHQFGLVYSDPDMLVDGAVRCELPTWKVLNRFFANPRLSGVVFNQTINFASSPIATTPVGTTTLELTHDTGVPHPASRETLARILGLLTSDDPLCGIDLSCEGPVEIDAAVAERHAELAQDAIDSDRPLVAMHHAACARHGNLPLHRWFLPELDACLCLGLTDRAMQLMSWYRAEYGDRPELLPRQAYTLSISARPEQALDLVVPLVDHTELGASACIELARAHYVAGRYDKAVASFRAARDRGDESADAHIGEGLALRMKHWDKGDRDGLKEAGECFQRAIETSNYHRPEARHHLSTICLALGDYERGELLAREALAENGSGIIRRNLVLFLRAQGRLEEAFAQYRLLTQYDPTHAAGLEHHFEVAHQFAKSA